jgi:two-component system, LytTR family, response regulator
MKNKLKCIIVDDEAPGRLVLRELLAHYCTNVDVVAEAGNITEAYDLITTHKPDFVLLDIQMPGGSGFDLLKKFDEIHFDVIFVTSYDKYAVSAIKFSALDYLLKPVEIQELVAAVGKVEANKNELPQKNQLYLNLLNNLDENTIEKKLPVHHKDKVRLISLGDVVSFEADSNYTQIFTTQDEKYSSAKLLKDFEEVLSSHSQFIRVNKSAIININYVREYSKGTPCIIYMNNSKEYEISRRKKAEIWERIKK